MFKLWSGETTLSLPSKQNVIQAAIPGWLPTGHISLSSVNVTPIYAKHCLCSTECILEEKKKEREMKWTSYRANQWMGNGKHGPLTAEGNPCGSALRSQFWPYSTVDSILHNFYVTLISPDTFKKYSATSYWVSTTFTARFYGRYKKLCLSG